MYEAEVPAPGTCVVGQIMATTPTVTTVRLPEYGSITAQCPTSFQGARGTFKVYKVQHIEIEQIGLSDQLSYDEISATIVGYKKAKQVHYFLQKLSSVSGRSIEEVYRQVGWPLYRDFGDAFKGLNLGSTLLTFWWQSSKGDWISALDSELRAHLGTLLSEWDQRKNEICLNFDPK
jgi:translation initiation factor 2 alpha subunit (eIF-2alpha)